MSESRVMYGVLDGKVDDLNQVLNVHQRWHKVHFAITVGGFAIIIGLIIGLFISVYRSLSIMAAMPRCQL